MGNKSKKLRRTQHGFIQIPILLVVLFSTLVGTIGGGGYYVIEHKLQSTKQNVAEKDKPATTTEDVATSTPLNHSFDDKIKNVSQSAKSTQGQGIDFKPLKTPKLPSVVLNGKERFQEFETRGKQLLTLIEQDEKNFKLLTDTIAQHKKQSADHATQIMDEWITLVEQTLASTPSQYGGLLLSTKNYLVSDRNRVVDYSNSLYDIVSNDSYLLKQEEITSLEFTKSELVECLKMNEKEWIALNGESCTISFLEFLKPDYSKRLTDGANKLSEIDLMVLEAIGKGARSAEDDVRRNMDTIARYTQLNASIQASYNSINNQLQQRQTQFETANTPLKCYTTTNSSIFDKSRTYNTNCQPDTRTAQQICDEKIAAWLGSGGAFVGAKPTCE